MNILITGSSGFIGSNLINFLKNKVNFIYGIDNFNNIVYEKKIKFHRSTSLKNINNFKEYNTDLSNFKAVEDIIIKNNIEKIIHLAAHPGVRNSFIIPDEYVSNNINNFLNIINLSKKYNIDLIYASSSSVYNSNVNKIPFSEMETVYNPDSIYGFTKLSNELISKIYYDKFNFKSIGLRFFSVYGKMGRPDMAISSFINALKKNSQITLNNYGKTKRDYTSIKTVVEAIYRVIFNFNKINESLLNIGNTNPIETLKILEYLKLILGNSSPQIINNSINEQVTTFADMSITEETLGNLPKFDIFDELNELCDL